MQSIKAIAEVNKSISRKKLCKRAPHFIKEGQTRELKLKSNYNGKYILLHKKGTPLDKQPMNSCSSNSKKNIFQTKNSTMCPSREDKGTSPSLINSSCL